MKRFLLALLLTMPVALWAQTFDNAVGIRGGHTSGFEFRIYTDPINSYKFLLGTRNDGIQIHALKEFHNYDAFAFTDQLALVYGLGVHFGYERWDEHYHKNNMSWHETRTAFLAGLDGLVGLEYLFYEVPISIGLEVKPYFDVLGREIFDLELFDFAFTLKYHF